MLIVVGLLLIIVLTAATGYFVAQEFGYVAVDRGKLKQLADDGDRAAARALEVTGRLSFMLSGAQLGITVTALLVGYVAEPYLGAGLAELLGVAGVSTAAALPLSVALALVIATVVQMVLGELAPKNLAIARAEPLARALSRSTLIYLRRRAGDHAVRQGRRPAAAPDRHRADRGTAQRRHPEGPGADHRRVPRGGAPRRRDVRPARPGARLPGADRRGGHGAPGRRAHRPGRRAGQPGGRAARHRPLPVPGARRRGRRRPGRRRRHRRRAGGAARRGARRTPVERGGRSPAAGAARRCRCRRCWTGSGSDTGSSPAWSTSTAASPA